MGLGFGSLKQMSDSFRYNRDLLGKRKSAREMYKAEIKKRGTTEEAQNLEFVRERVAHALRRNRSLELLARIAAALIFFCILAGVIWAAVNIDFTLPKKKKYADKSDLFNTIIYDQSGDLKLRTDYFHSGPKASETYLKDGFKHQNSESYYE